ncbi:hypothetical protein [Marinobacter sediminum]|uniref:hypothetical protein n=1 Tax=Marinobacter sediminum TaxID=256323 RepID=UPI00193A19AD|nr:hypothetical protein [Marinobacter sediminum]
MTQTELIELQSPELTGLSDEQIRTSLAAISEIRECYRDQVLAESRGQALADVREDRRLEVTGTLPVDLDTWAEALTLEQQRRALPWLPSLGSALANKA